MRSGLTLVVVVLTLAACDASTDPDAGGMDGGPGGDAGACGEDLECSDGLFCTGLERCAPGPTEADPPRCAPALVTDPCAADEMCDEDNDRCVRTECSEPDADGDGVNALGCGGSDCDDRDAERFPGAVEICDAADRDEDCDPTTFGVRDLDGDGEADAACCNADPIGTPSCGRDCDDTNRMVNTTAQELCNARDDDCNGVIDDDLSPAPCFTDGDRDGWAPNGASSEIVCGCPVGTTNRDPTDGADCDDGDERRHPMAVELCDSVDQDCDGDSTDIDMLPCWADGDNDGWAASGAAMSLECGDPARPSALFCPAGRTGRDPAADDDCNDANAGIFPMAPEACTDPAVDQNCNGDADEGFCYRDVDGDGYAASGAARVCGDPIGSCPSGYTPREPSNATTTDCDDTRGGVSPGSAEMAAVCDGRDDDCDGTADDGVTVTTLLYPDTDGDSYGTGAGGSMTYLCTARPSGYATQGGDCCDSDARARPNQTMSFTSARVGCGGFDFNCDGNVIPVGNGPIPMCGTTCTVGGGCATVTGQYLGRFVCTPTTMTNCGTAVPECVCGRNDCADACSFRMASSTYTVPCQ